MAYRSIHSSVIEVLFEILALRWFSRSDILFVPRVASRKCPILLSRMPRGLVRVSSVALFGSTWFLWNLCCCCVTSPGSRVGARLLVPRCYGFYKVLDSPRWFVSADVKARVQRPASGSSLCELESNEGEKQERMNTALAPCFKQSDLDSPTGSCSNQSVRVGQSPACTASLAKYTSSDITSYMIINLLSHVHSFIIVTKSAV